MNVLIVEDCLATATMLEGYVLAAGHQPICVPAPWLTTSSPGDWPVDLVLLDIVLPGANGYDLAVWMRDEGLRAPIIAVTATEDNPAKRREHGIDGYLGKPVSMQDLQAAIDALQLQPS